MLLWYIVCQLWQRISALEEMLRNVHSMLSSITETAGPSITNVNQTPEFRAPHPVPLPNEVEANQQYPACSECSGTSCGCSELLSKSVDSNPAVRGKMAAPTVYSCNRTAPIPSPLSKRRKFTDD